MADPIVIPGTPNPISFPADWDTFLIGTVPSPGLCVVRGWTRSYEWDVKAGKGTVGATITFVQKPPAKGEITFYLWDDGTLGTGHNHFDEWQSFVPLLKYDPTKKAVSALSVWHPALASIDVASVVCEEIGQLEVDQSSMMCTVTCKFVEYWPPPKKSAVGTAHGSTSPASTSGANGTGAPTNPPNPYAQEQQQIADLWGKATAP